jgi:hypothetical protein
MNENKPYHHPCLVSQLHLAFFTHRRSAPSIAQIIDSSFVIYNGQKELPDAMVALVATAVSSIFTILTLLIIIY